MDDTTERRPILCLDFDGVLHSYVQAWQGAAVIPDLPVPGAMRFLRVAVDHFEVSIFSARSGQEGGVEAMRSWIRHHQFHDLVDPPYVSAEVAESRAQHLVEQLGFPTSKPPAFVTLDDRAIQFSGTFPPIAELQAFRPWNRRGV
jgi:hypothetical protein